MTGKSHKEMHLKETFEREIETVEVTNSLRLDEIVGQEEAVSVLKDLVQSIKLKPVFKLWNYNIPKGILLTGGTGLGKTESVRALVYELKDSVVLMELRYLEAANKFVDAPIETLRKFFGVAEEYAKTKHVIIVIDEIEAFLPNRNDENGLLETTVRRVDVFLEWMDGGLTDNENITIIGTTNCPDLMDPAALRPGRFDRKIEFCPLTKEAIIKGLEIHYSKKALGELLTDCIDFNEVGKNIKEGDLSGADMPEIINRLVYSKVKEHIDIIKSNYSNFETLTEDKKMEVAAMREYMPSKITTEDFIKSVNEYMKSLVKNNNTKSFGFSAHERTY